jgi:predicted O-methyltransferase YrrM
MPKRILEIGTGDGEATRALAETMPADGLLITIEPHTEQAIAARAVFSDAGFGDRIIVIVAEPRRFLHKVRGPFDLIVQNDPDDRDALHGRLIAMLAPGGVLIRGNKKYSV